MNSLHDSRRQSCAQLLMAGYSVESVARDLGISNPTVYKYARESEIDMRKRPGAVRSMVAEHESDIRQMIASGCSYQEVADRVCMNKETVRAYCLSRGLRSTAATRSKQMLTESEIADRVKAIDSALTYIDGYKNNKSKIRISCSRCGQEINMTLYSLEHIHGKKRNKCPACAKKDRQKKLNDAKKEQDLALVKIRAERAKTRRLIQEERERELLKREKDKEHECCVCGAITTRPKYCSEKCAARAESKRRETIRRMKIADAMVDRDITLESLYKRDHGVCYICRCKTNFEDYTVRDATVICGNWYPSIDHVIPLAKGGKHSWQNVKLAHRICNSRKSDSV